MALIACPECDNRISDMASTCPQCGFPLATKTSAASTENQPTPTAIPQTRKRSSGNLLAAIPIIVVGFVLVFSPAIWLGLALMVVGAWLLGKWMREPREDFTRHLQIAADPAANPVWLEEISHSPNTTLRTQVALNNNTPTPTLERLAGDTNPEVSAEATAKLRERQTQDDG